MSTELARARRGVLFALLAALALAGCLEQPADQASGGSAVGAWELAAAGGCTQRLTLSATGTFSLSALRSAGTRMSTEQVDGTVTTGGDSRGRFAAWFAPNLPVAAGAAVYCSDWAQAPPDTLPFDLADAALGADTLGFTYFPSVVPGLGMVLTGADTNRRDRLILYGSASGALRAIRADDPASFPSGIYRALHNDPLPADDAFSARPVYRIPGGFYRASYTGTINMESLGKILLAITTAVDVTFSRFPDSFEDACSFVLYTDTGFTTLELSNPLNASAASQTRTFNPAGGWLYATHAMGSTTVYLIPVEIRSPADGDCEALIQARAIADRVASDHAATPEAATLFTAGLPNGAVFLGASPPQQPGRMERLNIRGGQVPFAAYILDGSLAALAATSGSSSASSAADPLHLKAATPAAAVLSVGGGPAGGLNIFPGESAATGWGPFGPAAPPAAQALAIPAAIAVSATADDPRTDYLLTVAAAQRIAIWTDGGISTTGRLDDGAGRILAISAGGAADHAGFRIEVDLSPGTYPLQVSASPGAFALHTAVLAGPAAFADAALDQCMVEAGWALAPGEPVTSALCAGRAILAIDDIGLAGTLEQVDLGRNAISDVSALQSLFTLRSLRLDGNPVTDLSPLAGLTLLRQLSLAETPVSAAGLAVLQGMGNQLALLDLTGVTTLSQTNLDTLRAAMPLTTIVGPDGTVLP